MVSYIGYTHGIKWTDELIISEITRVIKALELDRFPTHSEIENFYGNKSLAIKISKSGGTKYWANRLGYEVKQCESEFGDFYETYALNDIFNNTSFRGYKNKVGYPYDLTINHHIKVDVKSSSLITNNQGYQYYTFNLEKKEPTCDIYLIYCLSKENEIFKTYIVPSCKLYGQTQIGISAFGNSKWDSYINYWNIFYIYDEFYQMVCTSKGA